MPNLMEGQTATLQKTEDGCCQEYVVCDAKLCPLQSTYCPFPKVLVKTQDKCCPTYNCGNLYFSHEVIINYIYFCVHFNGFWTQQTS